ncbi:hypothetical protein S1361_30430 [Streptomyces cyanogenus]|uniref:Uncharacterized protein n=1 Tax=Streptomyces cyanogenus TaxID=80860 RepID=A0ABX7U2R9_STRCY|nr:hypothetical protein S1361_30430 [Streptomyces cyanogenus]
MVPASGRPGAGGDVPVADVAQFVADAAARFAPVPYTPGNPLVTVRPAGHHGPMPSRFSTDRGTPVPGTGSRRPVRAGRMLPETPSPRFLTRARRPG